ncbi:IS3 family transposase [Gordonia sp. NPDC003425]
MQTPADPDAALREQLRTYARKNHRHGLRRAWAHVRFDDGIEINKKEVHRLWKEGDLQVRRSPRRKRAGQSSVAAVVADTPKSSVGVRPGKRSRLPRPPDVPRGRRGLR